MTNHCQIGSSSNNNQPSSSSIFLTVLPHTILSHHPITCNAIFSAKAFIHGGMRLEIHFTHLRHSPLTPPPSSFCLAASACPHHVPPATTMYPPAPTMYPPDALPASSYPHDVPAALADSLFAHTYSHHSAHSWMHHLDSLLSCFRVFFCHSIHPSTCTFLQGT